MANETSGTPGTDERDAGRKPDDVDATSDDVDASKPEETADEKIARLEAAQKQWLSEKAGAEQRAKELEETKRQLAEKEARDRASTPPTPQYVSPIDQEIAELADQARAYPQDATVRRALKNALQERQEMQRQHIIAQAEPEFQAMPEKYRAKAKDAWLQGRAARPSDALSLVKGEAAGDDPAAERERQEADRAAAARMAGTPPTAAAGGSNHSRNQTKTIAASEYNRRLEARDAKLMDDVDSGRVEVDYTR